MVNYKGEDRLEKHYTTEDLLDKLFEMKDRLIDFEITEYLDIKEYRKIILDKLKEIL